MAVEDGHTTQPCETAQTDTEFLKSSKGFRHKYYLSKATEQVLLLTGQNAISVVNHRIQPSELPRKHTVHILKSF